MISNRCGTGRFGFWGTRRGSIIDFHSEIVDTILAAMLKYCH